MRLDGRDPPLIVHHEVAHLPAVSVLLTPPPPPADAAPTIAVLADPVFGPTDPRVALERSTVEEVAADTATTEAVSTKTAAVREAEALPRLPHTRREAEAIAALAPGRVDLHLGFDAQRERSSMAPSTATGSCTSPPMAGSTPRIPSSRPWCSHASTEPAPGSRACSGLYDVYDSISTLSW